VNSIVRQLLLSIEPMDLPPEIAAEIRSRLEYARESCPVNLSGDRQAVMLHGSIGYGCYFSPDGDIFIEQYDIGSDESPTVNRSREAQIAALVLTSRYMPQLAALLPKRPANAPSCRDCDGTGWLHQEMFRRVFKSEGLLCTKCSGLGWLE
jgi:hypothetical protein